jgi:hypothetical protein
MNTSEIGNGIYLNSNRAFPVPLPTEKSCREIVLDLTDDIKKTKEYIKPMVDFIINEQRAKMKQFGETSSIITNFEEYQNLEKYVNSDSFINGIYISGSFITRMINYVKERIPFGRDHKIENFLHADFDVFFKEYHGSAEYFQEFYSKNKNLLSDGDIWKPYNQIKPKEMEIKLESSDVKKLQWTVPISFIAEKNFCGLPRNIVFDQFDLMHTMMFYEPATDKLVVSPYAVYSIFHKTLLPNPRNKKILIPQKRIDKMANCLGFYFNPKNFIMANDTSIIKI